MQSNNRKNVTGMTLLSVDDVANIEYYLKKIMSCQYNFNFIAGIDSWWEVNDAMIDILPHIEFTETAEEAYRHYYAMLQYLKVQVV